MSTCQGRETESRPFYKVNYIIMKKIFLIIVTSIIATMTSAQPRSVGGSLGWSETVTYQHSVNSGNFIELNFGYHCGLLQSSNMYPETSNGYLDDYYEWAKRSAGTLRMTATYNMIIMSPQWTDRGEWNFYAGPGVSMGSGFNTYKAFCFGVTGQAGLEFNFWFPLTLSADLRPTIGIMVAEGRIKYDTDGLMGFLPTISAKFRF